MLSIATKMAAARTAVDLIKWVFLFLAQQKRGAWPQ
jgi:hypothetical protein